MKRLLIAAVGVLALAACTEDARLPVGPATPRFASGDAWRIFGSSSSPTSTLDATGGWEVGTRFYATAAGCITHLHFYKASGESGDNYVKVWTNSGTLLYSGKIADSFSGTGWKTLFLAPLVGPPIIQSICIPANTYYRVTVNTNVKQGKTLGYFDPGAVVHGALVADKGYYGQPAGSFPTTQSGSGFFVDVTFVED